MAIDQKKLMGYANTRGKQFMPIYAAAAQKHGVPLGLLVAQGAQESGYWDPDVVSGKRVSSAGAQGVGQFVPATAERFGINPLDPQQSIDAQAKYMRANADMFDGDWAKALAGYNWGEGNVQKKGLGNAPAETRDYLAKIMPFVGGGSARTPAPSAPQTLGFDASKYVNQFSSQDKEGKEAATKPAAQDVSKYTSMFSTPVAEDTQDIGPSNPTWMAKQAELEAEGLPVSAEYLRNKDKSFGEKVVDTVAMYGSGAGDVAGNVLSLVGADGAAAYFKEGADNIDTLHNSAGFDAGDVAKFAGQVAPMMAVPVLRAAPAGASKLLPQVAESALTRGARYLGNAALQSGSAYAFMPEESRGSAAGLAGAVALGVPLAGKALQGIGAVGRGVGNFTAKTGSQAAILSSEVAAGRQLYYGLGAESVNDVARAATQAQDDLASTLTSLSRNSTKPLSNEAVDVAERMAIGAPNYLPQTADELGNLVSIAKKVLGGTAPIDQFAVTQAANAVGSSITTKVPGLQVARQFMPSVAEQYLGRAMAEKLVAAANNPVELARLIEAGMKQPGWSKFIEASGNTVVNASNAVANVGGYMTRYGPPMAAPATALGN